MASTPKTQSVIGSVTNPQPHTMPSVGHNHNQFTDFHQLDQGYQYCCAPQSPQISTWPTLRWLPRKIRIILKRIQGACYDCLFECVDATIDWVIIVGDKKLARLAARSQRLRKQHFRRKYC